MALHNKSEGATPNNGFHARSASKGGSSTRSTSTSRQLAHVSKRLEKSRLGHLTDIHSAPITPSVDTDNDPIPDVSTTDTETSSGAESKSRPRLKNLRGLSAATLRPSRSRTRRGPGLAIDRVMAQAEGRLESLSEMDWRDEDELSKQATPRPQTEKDQMKPYYDMMQRVASQMAIVLQDLADKVGLFHSVLCKRTRLMH